MQGRFPQLSAFGRKILEVCGAGLASAAAACLIGQTDKAEAPLAPIVYLAPGDAEMLKLMHGDQAARLDSLRRPPAAAPAAVVATPAPISTPAPMAMAAITPAPLPTPAVSAAPTRREAKSENAPVVAAVKRRPEQPSPNVVPAAPPVTVATTIAPVPLPLASEPKTYEPPSGNGAIGSAVAEAAEWVSSLKQIPGWFWPAGGGLTSTAPRPPAPVGGLLPHMM